jgi:hypothetical protein
LLDPEIRRALIPLIRPPFGTGRLLREVGIWGNSVRIDLARLTTDAFDGYEIKSEADSLTRLNGQAEIYSLVCDTVTLVAARRHLGKAIATIPEWWGLVEAAPTDDGVSLSAIRPAAANPVQSPARIAGLLWKDEALAQLRDAGKERGLAKLRSEEAYRMLAEAMSLPELKAAVFARIASRADWLNRHDPVFVGPFAPRVSAR